MSEGPIRPPDGLLKAPPRCELCGGPRDYDYVSDSRVKLQEVLDWLANMAQEDEEQLRRMIQWFAAADRLNSQALKIILARMLAPRISLRELAKATGVSRNSLSKITRKLIQEYPGLRELFRAGWKAAEAQRKRREREHQAPPPCRQGTSDGGHRHAGSQGCGNTRAHEDTETQLTTPKGTHESTDDG